MGLEMETMEGGKEPAFSEEPLATASNTGFDPVPGIQFVLDHFLTRVAERWPTSGKPGQPPEPVCRRYEVARALLNPEVSAAAVSQVPAEVVEELVVVAWLLWSCEPRDLANAIDRALDQAAGSPVRRLDVHLATWLALQDRRVVLVDLDTQGSVARFLGLNPADDLHELFQAVLNLRPDRRPPLSSFLTPVPGYHNLVLIRAWGRSARLEAALAAADHVIVPGIPEAATEAGALQEAALAAADHVIVLGIPEAATEAGVLDIARRLQVVGRGITGIVPTKIASTAGEHRRTIADWKAALGPIVYYNPRDKLFGLPRQVIWGELVRCGRPIWDTAPRDKAAREMEAVVRRIAYDSETH